MPAWQITDRIFELREFHGGNLVLGAHQRVLPVIPMSCGRCGYTRFLNAIHLGLWTEPEVAEVGEDEELEELEAES